MNKDYCRDCACLIEGANGEWVCEECQQPIDIVLVCPETEQQVFASVHLTFNRAAIEKQLDYRLICETMCSSQWNTTKRKREMANRFTEEELSGINTIYQQAYRWYLKTGVPDELELTTKQYALWLKLARFCYELPDFKLLDV